MEEEEEEEEEMKNKTLKINIHSFPPPLPSTPPLSLLLPTINSHLDDTINGICVYKMTRGSLPNFCHTVPHNCGGQSTPPWTEVWGQ